MARKPEQCRLCHECRVLCDSHIIPHFVYRWLRSTSPGLIRTSERPNVRLQDGPKLRWLCEECEQRFASAEREFAREIFEPLHSDNAETGPLKHGRWGHYFMVSVSWRTLLWSQEHSPNDHLRPADKKRVVRALEIWRDYLLGRRYEVGRFVQHALPLGAPTYAGSKPSPYLSRYLERATHLDLVESKYNCFVYTKLARLLVFGMIRGDRPNDWRGTRVDLLEGTIGGAVHYRVPRMLENYLNTNADKVLQTLESLSPRQKTKIAATIAAANPDELASSPMFRAVIADYELSGNAAFAKADPGDGEDDRGSDT